MTTRCNVSPANGARIAQYRTRASTSYLFRSANFRCWLEEPPSTSRSSRATHVDTIRRLFSKNVHFCHGVHFARRRAVDRKNRSTAEICSARRTLVPILKTLGVMCIKHGLAINLGA